MSTTVILRNEAPDGPPSALLGSNQNGAVPGQNLMTIHALLPLGATLTSVELDGRDSVISSYLEESFPVIWRVVSLAPQEKARFDFVYRVPGAVRFGSTPTFEFAFTPQATVNADRLIVSVKPPPGFELQPLSPRSPSSGSLEIQLREPVTLRYELMPN